VAGQRSDCDGQWDGGGMMDGTLSGGGLANAEAAQWEATQDGGWWGS
jgi:hypothetical protein